MHLQSTSYSHDVLNVIFLICWCTQVLKYISGDDLGSIPGWCISKQCWCQVDRLYLKMIFLIEGCGPQRERHTSTISPDVIILVVVWGVAPGSSIIINCGTSCVCDATIFEGEDTDRGLGSCSPNSWYPTVIRCCWQGRACCWPWLSTYQRWKLQHQSQSHRPFGHKTAYIIYHVAGTI